MAPECPVADGGLQSLRHLVLTGPSTPFYCVNVALSHPIHDRSLSVASAATVAFELLPWSVAVLDERGTIVAVNKAWRDSAQREALGLADDGVGASYLEICDTARGHGAEDARAVAEAIRDLLSAAHAEYLFEYSCHGPTEQRWFLARFRGREIDGQRVVTVVHQDVTDRRKIEEARQIAARRELETLVDARTSELSQVNRRLVTTERELRQSELRFRAAANATADVIVEMDLQQGSLKWFGDVDGQLGYAQGEFPRTRTGFTSYFHPDDQERVGREVARAFAANETFQFEGRVRCKDGSFRNWESRGRVIAHENGRPSLAIGTHRDITERKHDEARLKASEHRFRMVAESTADLIAEVSLETDVMDWHGDVDNLLGYDPGEFPRTMTGWLGAIHPDDLDRVREVLDGSETLGTFEAKYRIRCKDGHYRDWEGRGTNFLTSDGRRIGLGAITDVTEREAMTRARRQAEVRLQELTTRLFTAQEDERRLLAREFHDAFGQQTAAVSIQLGSLRVRHPDLPDDVRQALGSIQAQVVELSNDLRRVAHELHPAGLEQLGLEAALRAHCDSLSAHERVAISFSSDGCPTQLPPNIAICVFRVTQTALRNVVRHSGAREAVVALRASGHALELSIEDDGVGFDVSEAKRRGGLGLVSMEERVRPMGGQLSITSAPGNGTQVLARVPLSSSLQSEPAEASGAT